MIYLKSIRCPPAPADGGSGDYPFSLPFVSAFRSRAILAPALFFVGDNGSGKSTLLESLAIASKRIAVAGADLAADSSLDAVRPFAARLALGWTRRAGKGFFLRAEDFFGFIKRHQELAAELDGLADRFKDDPRVRGYMKGSRDALNARWGRDLNDFSHGEGFLEFLKARIVPGGLYLIDEPEAALSPQRQLAFALLLRDMAAQDCQFIVATHSPIILSLPGAQIWSFTPSGIEDARYDELEHVSFTKSFLQSPERYWRHLDAEE